MSQTEQETTPNKMMTTEELLSDFFFVIFVPNPTKNNVRVIIDDGTIKLYTNIPKFVSIIKSTMNNEVATIVKNCCETYGCWYLIDRCNGDVRKLNNDAKKGVIYLSEMHDDIMKAKQEGDRDGKLYDKYLNTLNKSIDDEMKKRLSGCNTVTGNRYQSTIIYGQSNLGTYKPC